MRDPGVGAVRAARWPEGARGFGAELCPNLGDGAVQTAQLCWTVMTSMPSANLIPATIFGN
jgi:hypothetical protein